MPRSSIGAERGLTRFEAFTDGVFAIALTLVIAEMRAPGAPDGPDAIGGLIDDLRAEWRGYLSLVISFVVIGAYWLKHHYTGRIYAKTDHVFSLLNLVFLFFVTMVPLPVRTWAEHAGSGADGDLATLLLVSWLALPAAAWMGKWLYAVRGWRLLEEDLDRGLVRRLTLTYAIGLGVLLLAIPVAMLAPNVGLAISLSVTVFFLFPLPRPNGKTGEALEPGD